MNQKLMYGHKYDLIEAEMAFESGDVLRAMDLYEAAIEAAELSGFLQEESIANELCGKFWMKIKKKNVAIIYLEKPYYLFKAWGAVEKAESLYQKISEYQGEPARPKR